MENAIVIRFDGPPSQQGGRFIEVENLEGASIKVGEWRQDGDDWLLVIERSQQEAAPEFNLESEYVSEPKGEEMNMQDVRNAVNEANRTGKMSILKLYTEGSSALAAAVRGYYLSQIKMLASADIAAAWIQLSALLENPDGAAPEFKINAELADSARRPGG